MRYTCFVALCFMLMHNSVVQAENYYLQALNSIKVSAEKLQKSAEKVKKHKDIKIQDQLEIPPFHKRQEWEKNSLSRTFCTTCHLAPPHTKNLRSRAFLNMHTEYIACETCHLRPENVDFQYQWLDYRTNNVVAANVNLFRQPFNEKDTPKSGEKKTRKTDKLNKIAPFMDSEPAMILRDHDFALQSINIWKEGSLDQRVARRAKIHAPLKEKGPECKACHQTDKPMLDLKALGANNRQLKRIQRHIVPQFFKRYTKDDQKIRIDNLLK